MTILFSQKKRTGKLDLTSSKNTTTSDDLKYIAKFVKKYSQPEKFLGSTSENITPKSPTSELEDKQTHPNTTNGKNDIAN